MVIYPFVFAIFPILSLYASNISQTPLKEMVVPLVISLAVTAVLFLILWLVLKSTDKAGLITSAFIVLFYLHRPLTLLDNATGKILFVAIAAATLVVLAALLIRYRENIKELISAHKVFVLVSSVVVVAVLAALALFHNVRARRISIALLLAFIVLAILIFRYKGDFQKSRKVMNIVAVVLLGLVIINISFQGVRSSSSKAQAHKGVPVKKVAGLDVSELPDIYYIILDGYVGEQTLKDYYKFDNGEFTGFLEEKGFYVVPEGRSNYVQSVLSLASSLNMEHVTFLTQECGKNSNSVRVPYRMIQDNAVSRFLKLNGYKMVQLASNWEPTRLSKNADFVLGRHSGLGLEFIDTLIKSTPLRDIIDVGGVASREDVLYAFSKLPKTLRMIESPRFVFAHIISPHPPFRFDRNGNPVKNPGESTVWGRHRESDYINQLIYTNKRVKQIVSEILANSKKPPVIILQGDHGSGFLLKGSMVNPSAGAVRERTGILNAYYMPPGGEGAPYQTLTPVNSFRLIFDRYFRTSYGQLGNRVYWSTTDKPYDFTDVTATTYGGK